MFEDGDIVEGNDVYSLKEWTGKIITRRDGIKVVLNEDTKNWKKLDDLADIRLVEDFMQTTVSTSQSNNNNTSAIKTNYKNYSDYLDSQIQSLSDKGAKLDKMTPDQMKKMSHSYADLAKNKFSKLEGIPKDDKESENLFNNVLTNKAIEKSAESSAGNQAAAENAQKTIDEISDKLSH